MFHTTRNEPDKKELRNFGLVTGVFFVLVFTLLLPWIFEHESPSWPWIVATVLWSLGLVLPGSLRRIYHLWMMLGHGLGWLNSRIILGIMFYLIILPTGMLLRLFGKDPLAKQFDKSNSSYRVVNAVRKKDHVERPF